MIKAPRDRPLTTFLDGRGDLRALELLRIAAGPIVIAHLWPFLQRAVDGVVYSDRFYQPYVSWYPEASSDVYVVLLWLAVGSAIALSLGAATRVAAAYTAGFVAYNLFLSQTHFHHNRAFLLVMLLGLALLPMGRRLSVDAWVRRHLGKPASSEGPLWPLLLMRFEVVAVFLVSGFSKLIDPDWWGGTVLRIRFADGRTQAEDLGVPDWLLDFVATSEFHAVFGKVAVLTELAIGLGLAFRATRLAALWLEVAFHVSIEAIFAVQVFSYAALAATVIWVTPSARDRTLALAGAARGTRLLQHTVRWLDWTGRMRLEKVAANGHAITLSDRDGSVVHGAAAVRLVLSRLPLTFWFVAPVRLIDVWRRARFGRLS